MSVYEEFIDIGHYCRWNEKLQRREVTGEPIERYYVAMAKQVLKVAPDHAGADYVLELLVEGIEASHQNEVMPSMRALWSAGPALERDHVAAYNCAYTAISGEGEELTFEHPKLDDKLVVHLSDVVCFDELMYVCLCGTGVGFSVERQYINSLPKVGKKLSRRRYLPFDTNYPGVPKEEISTFDRKTNTVYVHDSKYGWASALRIIIVELYNGNFDVEWDVSGIRPAGAVLKTFGGRASGPEPLVKLFSYLVSAFKQADGRRLNSLECHDICCMIGDSVVSGGVRRTALLSLSNLTDDRMRRAKSGDWRVHSPHRELANNSVCYTEKPDFPAFLKEWCSLYESYSGERGIFFRGAAEAQAARSGRRMPYHHFGVNPCSEIILRIMQFCNLSEAVVRRNDTIADLRRKVSLATVFGTVQSTFTDFRYLRSTWKENCEEERLLGVSLTGIMDHPVMANRASRQDIHDFSNGLYHELKDVLEDLKQVAIDTNAKVAKALGINPSAAITCIKPSGTVSQRVNCASGIHPRYSAYYIRRVKVDDKDPLAAFMIDQGIPNYHKKGNYIFEFPIKSPEGAVTAGEFLGIEQLELWKLYQDHWCEHKPSITVYYRDEDFLEIGQWVYDHFEEISGIAFLPYDGHVYEDAPYEPITAEKYEELAKAIPESVDWVKLSAYEKSDSTTGSKSYACTGSTCEVVDV